MDRIQCEDIPDRFHKKKVVINIIVPTAGSVPDPRIAANVVDIAKRLNAQLFVLRVLTESETEAAGQIDLIPFSILLYSITLTHF